jgi:YMGG-like Gly-zipper
MKSITLFSAAILLYTSSIAQDSSAANQKPKGKAYSLHVIKTDGSVQKGYLYGANADGIILTMNTKQSSGFTQLAPEQIDKLFLRRKGNVGRGLLFGALGGAAIGAIIGSTSGDDDSDCYGCIFDFGYSREEKAAIGATVGFFSGAGLGIVLGALTKKKFIIHGQRENYKASYNDILERAMTQQ